MVFGKKSMYARLKGRFILELDHGHGGHDDIMKTMGGDRGPSTLTLN
jgi:hypothetical protein